MVSARHQNQLRRHGPLWFDDVDTDGWGLDDKLTKLLPPEKLGPVPKAALTADEHAKNNLPDIRARGRSLGFGVPASAGKVSAARSIKSNENGCDHLHLIGVEVLPVESTDQSSASPFS
jgi:hypothetical protein